jgi:hypothetical protein
MEVADVVPDAVRKKAALTSFRKLDHTQSVLDCLFYIFVKTPSKSANKNAKHLAVCGMCVETIEPYSVSRIETHALNCCKKPVTVTLTTASPAFSQSASFSSQPQMIKRMRDANDLDSSSADSISAKRAKQQRASIAEYVQTMEASRATLVQIRTTHAVSFQAGALTECKACLLFVSTFYQLTPQSQPRSFPMTPSTCHWYHHCQLWILMMVCLWALANLSVV